MTKSGQKIYLSLKSGHIRIKDAQCAEIYEVLFFRFLVFEIWSICDCDGPKGPPYMTKLFSFTQILLAERLK